MHADPDRSERELLTTVDRGLEIAVRDLGLEWEDEANVTKREKYRFIAIDALSDDALPVTYSWFIYGVSAIADKEYVSDPMPVHDPEAAMFDLGVQEFADYYTATLPQLQLADWWEEPVLDFLGEFYTRYCPPDLRPIYLANIDLRRLLERRIVPRMNTPGAEVSEAAFTALRRELLTIQTELASDEAAPAFDGVTLRDLYDDFLAYAELLEGAVLAVVRTDAFEPSGRESDAITHLKQLFDDTVWPMITSVISYRTVRGPNPDVIRNTAAGKFANFKSVRDDGGTAYETAIAAARDACLSAGLDAGPEAYPDADDDIAATVDELLAVIDGTENE